MCAKLFLHLLGKDNLSLRKENFGGELKPKGEKFCLEETVLRIAAFAGPAGLLSHVIL